MKNFKLFIIHSKLTDILIRSLTLVTIILISSCDQPAEKNAPVRVSKNNLIVAPAVVDSVKDVTRLSVLRPGIVSKILVNTGDIVKPNATLLILDDTKAKLAVESGLEKLSIQKTELLLAQEALSNEKRYSQIYQNVGDPRAVSKIEKDTAHNKVNQASRVVVSQKKQVELAKTSLKIAELQLKDYKLRAPYAGIVLQIGVKEGEYVIQSYEKPAIILGDEERAYVRVAIDEHDIWKFKKESRAFIEHDGNEISSIPLTFVRIDPYVVAKEFSIAQSTTNSSETRVLEVLYYFDRKKFPSVFPGQRLDVHIEITRTANR